MKIVVDTNIFISSMLTPAGNPAQIVEGWLSGTYQVIVCQTLLDELADAASRPKLSLRISAEAIEALVFSLSSGGLFIDEPLPEVAASPDPKDNYLLALAEKGRADFLVTGDKADLLVLCAHGPTQIVTARAFLGQLAAISPLPARPR
jgi:uncharacterized protein